MAGSFPLVKGTRLRATKVNACGMPLAGPRNRLVTKGWVSLTLTPVMREAQDIEQINAEGRVCFQDRTPPERKWYTPALELCGVNPGLITMFTGWENVLDYNDLPIGFRDKKEIESELGIALEVWTSGKTDEDCADIPTSDSVFSASGTGRKYGYFLFGGTEWTLGDIAIGASVASLTLTGRTIALPYWGRGPYNVSALDDDNTPGRLLEPTSTEEHLTVFRTPIEPPEPTAGSEPVALSTTAIFTDPNFYYGGPAAEPAAEVAPDQAAAGQGYALTETGVPTGGTISLNVDYPDQGDKETGTIVYNATPAQVKTALVALDDGFDAADWTVTGTNLPAGTVTIVPPEGVVITAADNNLTGGTAPAPHVSPV